MYKSVYSLFRKASCGCINKKHWRRIHTELFCSKLFCSSFLFSIYTAIPYPVCITFHLQPKCIFQSCNIEQEISMLFQLRLARELGFCEGVQITCLFTNALPCLARREKKSRFSKHGTAGLLLPGNKNGEINWAEKKKKKETRTDASLVRRQVSFFCAHKYPAYSQHSIFLTCAHPSHCHLVL